MERDNNEIEIDLLEVFLYLKNRFWVILASGLILALISGLFTKFLIVPTYSSTSKLYILSSSTSLTSLADIQIGTSLTKDYVQLVQSPPVVKKVIGNLGLEITYDEMVKKMVFTNPADTRILEITCKDNNPVLAKDIVNEFAEVARNHISEIMKTDAPTVAQYGEAAERPISPSLRKNVAVGGLAGVAIACAIYIILFLMDDTVKTAEDIEKYLGINTLTAIPLDEDEEGSLESKKAKKSKKGEKKNGK